MHSTEASLPPSPIDNLVRVVLVEPEHSLNIGSVARAMANFGFSQLHLVAPKNFQQSQAHITACWASGIVDTATIHQSLNESVKDMESVIGFSSYEGNRFFGQRLLPEWLEIFRKNPLRKTALLFGTEEHGLRREHLEKCEYVVRIPTAAECPSINLAQSVLLLMYELRKVELKPPTIQAASEAKATEADLTRVDLLLEKLSVQLKLSRLDETNPIPGRLRNLLRRMGLAQYEARLLTTFFSRITRRLGTGSP